jgi:hypothetical protein
LNWSRDRIKELFHDRHDSQAFPDCGVKGDVFCFGRGKCDDQLSLRMPTDGASSHDPYVSACQLLVPKLIHQLEFE